MQSDGQTGRLTDKPTYIQVLKWTDRQKSRKTDTDVYKRLIRQIVRQTDR